jgi:hypothetical protein
MLSYILLSWLSPYIDKIIGDYQCGFLLTDQLLIRFSVFIRYGEKREYIETVHQLFIGSGIPMELFRLIKMCLNETQSKVHIGKHLPDSFPIQHGLKPGDALSPMIFNFALEYAIQKIQVNQV